MITTCKSPGRGFSLVEVTLSLGIIAAVLLPLIALLASGLSTETTTRDREVSSQLSRGIMDAIKHSPDGEIELHFTDKPVLFEAPSGVDSSLIYLSATAGGDWLGEVNESDYSSGVSPQTDSFYLIKLDLKRAVASQTDTVGLATLYDLAITIEHPAAASQTDRSSEVFRTRFAAP